MKTPEEIKEYKHNWYLKNKERLNQASKDRYNSDEEYRMAKIAQNAEYRKRPIAKSVRIKEWKTYKAKHGEEIQKRNKQYRINNKERIKVFKQNSRIKRKQQMLGGGLSLGLVEKLLLQQSEKCFYCDIQLKEYHLDHIEPLARGGEHKDSNIVLACPTCNLKKHAKDPEEFVNLIIEKGEYYANR